MSNTGTHVELNLQELYNLAEELNFTLPDIEEVEFNELKVKVVNYIENTLARDFDEYVKEWKEFDNKQPEITPREDAPREDKPKEIITFESLQSKRVEEINAQVNKDALLLVRVRVTCNNPNKKNYKGEIIAARNAVISEVKKFIPFNVPTHIPQILYNVMKEKMLQIFYEEKDAKGRTLKRSRLIPEYNIEELPKLTRQELEAIRQRQLAEQSQID